MGKKARTVQVEGLPVMSAIGIASYVMILDHEPLQGRFRYNHLKGRGEINKADEGDDPDWQNFQDEDLSQMRYMFQAQYGMDNRSDLDDALSVIFHRYEVNPVVQMLLSLEWDGTERIGHFLTDILGADDTAYVHEVSRLIFAGGVHRAMHPGCKFDDMPVLVGNQGGGKSSIVRWLNIADEYYREVTTIDGKEGVEALSGGWIVEFSEMMAMTSIKEVEGVKAYITRQSDHVRKAYGRYESDLQRRCIFIGTTNNDRFLTDKTGNRRFYPVTVRIEGYALFDREQEIRAYIRQCWAQAVNLWKRKELPPYADKALRNEFQAAQEGAMEDDWRVGKVEAYLETKKPGEYCCCLQVFNACIAGDSYATMSRKDSIDLGKIIASFPEWEKTSERIRFDGLGQQRAYRKKPMSQPEKIPQNAMQMVIPPDDIPF